MFSEGPRWQSRVTPLSLECCHHVLGLMLDPHGLAGPKAGPAQSSQRDEFFQQLYVSSCSKLHPRHHSKALHGFYRKEDNDTWRVDNNEAPPNPPPSHSPRETNPKTSALKNCLQWETFKGPETKPFSPATSYWSFLSF